MLPFRMFASRFACLLSVALSPHRSSLLRPLAKKYSFSAPLCFHTLTHSSKTCILPTPAPSIACALFAKNTGVGGYHGYNCGARTRHSYHQPFACKPFSINRLRTPSVTMGVSPSAFILRATRLPAAVDYSPLFLYPLSFHKFRRPPLLTPLPAHIFEKHPGGWG